MKEQIISFEVAKLAKEKEFDEYCFRGYKVNTKKLISISDIDFEEVIHQRDLGNDHSVFEELFFKNSQVINNYSITAPTQSLLQKWLREKHELSIEVFSDEARWEVIVEKLPSYSAHDSEYSTDDKFNTYEEALERGLKQALKLI